MSNLRGVRGEVTLFRGGNAKPNHVLLKEANMTTFNVRTTFLVAAIAACVGFPATSYAQADPDIEIYFSVALRQDKVQKYAKDVRNDIKFSGCEDVSGPQARFSHEYFVDHLTPVSDASRKAYAMAYFFCRPAKPEHYTLFSEMAIKYAKEDIEYDVRVLADTQKHPGGNCARQYCSLDGLMHHSHPTIPCQYKCTP
jgi:hypothetical protein